MTCGALGRQAGYEIQRFALSNRHEPASAAGEKLATEIIDIVISEVSGSVRRVRAHTAHVLSFGSYIGCERSLSPTVCPASNSIL